MPQEAIFSDTELACLTQDEIEFLREQIDTLKLELSHRDEQLQQVQQELKYTNQELCRAFQINRPSLEEAKKLANQVLVRRPFARTAVAELLSALYGAAVSPLDLEPSPAHQKAHLAKLAAHTQQLQTQFNQLEPQFVTLQTLSQELRVQCQALRAQRQKKEE
ncbi:MAG: hypothetical protein VKJ46_01045 [Leptolyngbyaceae bacterium]|nr:hypothetical protein [Leptolyngbyaceae bacterium]